MPRTKPTTTWNSTRIVQSDWNYMNFTWNDEPRKWEDLGRQLPILQTNWN